MKNAMVWGSEGGIGREILTVFDREDWQIAAMARKITGVSAPADSTYEADFTRWSEVNELTQNLRRMSLRFDVFVFAAGDIASQKVGDGDPERWVEILHNNLTAAFYTLHGSLPLLKEDAHIFLLGAISERLQLPGLSGYAAAKSGLEAFAVSLSKEERKKKVSVVRPGAVATSLWDKVPFNQPGNAYSPLEVAERVYEAYQEGHSGLLDLV